MYVSAIIYSFLLFLTSGKPPQNTRGGQAARQVAERWIKLYEAEDEKGLNKLCAPGYKYFGIETSKDSNYMASLLNAELIFGEIAYTWKASNKKIVVKIMASCDQCNKEATAGFYLQVENQASTWLITEVGNDLSERMKTSHFNPDSVFHDFSLIEQGYIGSTFQSFTLENYDRTVLLWIDKPISQCAPVITLCEQYHAKCLGAWWEGQPMLSLYKTSTGELLQSMKINYMLDSANNRQLDHVGLPARVISGYYGIVPSKKLIDIPRILSFKDKNQDGKALEFVLYNPSYGPNYCMLLTTLIGYIPEQDRLYQYYVEEKGEKDYWEEELFASVPKNGEYVITRTFPMASDSIIKTYRYNPSTYSFIRTTVRLPKEK